MQKDDIEEYSVLGDFEEIDLTGDVPASELSVFQDIVDYNTALAAVNDRGKYDPNNVRNKAFEDSLDGLPAERREIIKKYHNGAHITRLTSESRAKTNRERVWPSAKPKDVYDIIMSNQNCW